jgi:hypothetical protein
MKRNEDLSTARESRGASCSAKNLLWQLFQHSALKELWCQEKSMRLSIQGALSYNLPPEIDIGRCLEHPARIARNYRIQISHTALFAPDEGTTNDLNQSSGLTIRPDNLRIP